MVHDKPIIEKLSEEDMAWAPVVSLLQTVPSRSVWEVISKDKTGRRLARLKLHTTGGGDYGGDNPSTFLAGPLGNLSRSWLVESAVRDDRQDITVTELGQSEREASDRCCDAV